MSLNIGVVMDPIAQIKPWKDTTLAMLLEAQRRGWTRPPSPGSTKTLVMRSVSRHRP